ncbi:RNA helicase required for poly(A+) mRNA export [Actinomortierella wolfii]|nr:RNA helicase required for poly(A+) mRNA export [Actinomortierella wolfii]
MDLIEQLYNVIVKRRDGDNSPIQSATTFEELQLSEKLVNAVYMCKFVKPSKIQASAIPLILKGENLIAQAQSGTGKTAAFLLATLNMIDATLSQTQAIILVPTRELARQIVDVIHELGRYTNIKVRAAIPELNIKNLAGQQQHEQSLLLSDEAYKPINREQPVNQHIVVGTPGRTGDIIKRQLFDASQVKMVILDEADHMLDFQGLASQSLTIIRLLPRSVQKILFSATWRPDVLIFAENFAGRGCNRITLQMNEVALKSISQFYMDCRDNEHRFELLVSLYGMITVSQSIIFVKTRRDAQEIATRMRQRNHAVTELHGGMVPAQRDSRIDDFRNGITKVLISTNVLARGLDVANVNVVINYDLPTTQSGEADAEAYLHRIGRTGRFGRTGVTINFVHSTRCMEILRHVASVYSCNIFGLPTDSADEMEAVIKKVIKGRSQPSQSDIIGDVGHVPPQEEQQPHKLVPLTTVTNTIAMGKTPLAATDAPSTTTKDGQEQSLISFD